MKRIVFDSETAALPAEELEALIPGFDAAEVKLGNTKDPDKVAAKIREAEAKHREYFFERAALDALTGRVLAIGWVDFDQGGEIQVMHDDDEAVLLRRFWALARGEQGRLNTLVGFNITGFDLPFLLRRSWKHGVEIPAGLRRGRYWSESVIDVREIWNLGDRFATGSLDTVAKHLGFGGKSGNGSQFAALWTSDRAAAIAYLVKDVDLTARVAAALNAIP
jgi:hypothetical protein